MLVSAGPKIASSLPDWSNVHLRLRGYHLLSHQLLHRSLRRVIGTVGYCLAVFSPCSAFSADVPAVPLSLRWETPLLNEDSSCLRGSSQACSNDLSDIRIYRSETIGNNPASSSTLLASVSALATNFIDRSVTAGRRYTYTITARDSSGNESGRTVTINAIALSVVADNDGDSIPNGIDNCPLTANPQQQDSNGDGIGDACVAGDNPNCTDTDSDGVCDSADNCRTRPNADQVDSDDDQVGDECARNAARARCARSEASLSSIALSNSEMMTMVEIESGAAERLPLTSGVQTLISNFVNDTPGVAGLGDLEIAEVTNGSEQPLSIQIHNSVGTSAVTLGVGGGRVLACYVDGDDASDFVSVHKDSIATYRSSTGESSTFSIEKLGNILDVSCGDTDGDGRDELLVLSIAKNPLPRSTNRRALTLFDLQSGTQKSQKAADPRTYRAVLADTAGSLNARICQVMKLSTQRSALSCRTNATNPAIVKKFADLTVARTLRNSLRESLLVLNRRGELTAFSGSRNLVKNSVKNVDRSKASRATFKRIIQCR